ncbi:membrane-associated protein, putative [Bodo saltans]|uniref:Membrane-associated protein, putative n=1 Tax=Bodo saltans TaxID=75058 RepID=A0A0S4KK81_BODSA|nr:membrane-associated protein, putative [Bodo saltans]|eukprot:CUI13119.1 membrane-associated protein, putative [Bodo saltans]
MPSTTEHPSKASEDRAVLSFFAAVCFEVMETFRRNRYRFIFGAYILTVTWACAAAMYMIQRQTDHPASILQVWFVAISCFSGTGLGIVDITQWHPTAQVMMMIAMEFGSLVLCSALPSILRLRSLRSIHAADLNSSEALIVRRHYNVNAVIVWSCVVYWFLAQCISVFVLVLFCDMSWWWSFFHTASGFTNAGFGLDSRNFAIPELIAKPILVFWFVILVPIGFSLVPVSQRMLVRLWRNLARVQASLAVSSGTGAYGKWYLFGVSWHEFAEGADELLACPNLYYTHMFSPRNTWILFGLWAGLTLTDFLMFLPDFDTAAFLSEDHKWLQALFQAAATGLTMLDFTQLRLGHLVYWVAAMYLNTYPFMVTKKTAQLTEKPREVQDASRGEDASAPKIVMMAVAATSCSPQQNSASPNAWDLIASSHQTIGTIKQQAQTTIAAEIGYLFVASIFIAYLELNTLTSFMADDSPVLRLLFEVSSAYGTVGLSLSSSKAPTVSYSGIWSPASQVVVIALMYFGKFRGLPQDVSIHWVSRMIHARRASAKEEAKKVKENKINSIKAEPHELRVIMPLAASPPAEIGLAISELNSATSIRSWLTQTELHSVTPTPQL